MPRPKKAIPEYKFHISGQARVWLDGEWRYLGEHNSLESRAKYFALMQLYEENGQRLPDDVSSRQDDAPTTVRCVTAQYREVLDENHRDPAHRSRFRNLLTLLEDSYGNVPVDEFGPRMLREIRDLLVASGNCRNYVNSQICSIVSIFEHAVSEELVTADRLVALKSLKPLRAGKTKARESKKRQPVAFDLVAKTLPHLSPQVAAMVRLQAMLGCRPSELFKLKPSMIDRTGETWLYDLGDDHKTARHDRDRVIPLVAEVQEVLEPFLLRGADECCFSPAESAQWHRDQRTAKRKTKPQQGDSVGTNRKANPKRAPGKMFTKDSYNRAIRRACEKAGLARWTPYQIRHATATEVRRLAGLDAAQELLGVKDESRCPLVQFHQSTTYEDFIQGYRPDDRGGFQLRNGSFFEFVRKAVANPDSDFVFIIDEINRGNLSKVFGELMMLIEPDKRNKRYAVPLTYASDGDGLFHVPPNVHLIGTMNTADRSLSMVDYALRRRFAFVELNPGFFSPVFQNVLADRGAPSELIEQIRRRLDGLNRMIEEDGTNLGRGYRIGHSFFVPAQGQIPDSRWLEEIIRFEIVPLVEEYWCDDEAQLEKARSIALGRDS